MTAPDLTAYKSATGYRWVNSDGHDVSSDTVLFAVCADLKMLRDHQRNLRTMALLLTTAVILLGAICAVLATRLPA